MYVYISTVNANVTGEQMSKYRQSVFEGLQNYLKSMLKRALLFLCCPSLHLAWLCSIGMLVVCRNLM